MQLFTDCHQDLRLLDLRGLTPLDAEMAAGEPDLMAMIEGHNDRCGRAAARLRQLAEDRRRLRDFSAWEHKNGAALLAERARLRAEIWDALWEARHALEEREDVLTQIAQRLREQYEDAAGQHDQAVAAAKQRLAKERRQLERNNPSTAGSHFADLVAADRSVQAASERNAASRRAFEDAAAARRDVTVDLHGVATRQREVFGALMG